MNTQAEKPANTDKLSQNRKLASQAVIKPHATLRQFASLPDALPGQTRGMALIDKLDELIASAELAEAPEEQRSASQMKLSQVTERIDQRVTAVPEYAKFIEEVTTTANHLRSAVEQYGFSDSENVPFYRLLKEELLKKE